MMRFRLLGACAGTRFCVPRIIAKGTMLSVEEENGWVWAYDDKGERIGCFPPDVRDKFLRMPDLERWRFVEVESQVNLHDKYGECWVVPVVQ